jgi:hypothetical protein
MRLHEYSVFARFRYNDLKVGISSGNQALKRCAFVGTNQKKDEPITSGLPVTRPESAASANGAAKCSQPDFEERLSSWGLQPRFQFRVAAAFHPEPVRSCNKR